MYVRSHIDTVSGDRKYIYIDENNKKYIKNKNSYYPIKKYKGVYSLLKKHGGAGDASIDVKLLVYGKVNLEPYMEISRKIDLSNIVLNPNDDAYKDIIEEKKIYIFNKNFKGDKKNIIGMSDGDKLNHFVIIIRSDNSIDVYLRNIKKSDSFNIEEYKSYYNIIYKRNNKIDAYSESGSGEFFFVIFSISDDSDSSDDSKLNDTVGDYEKIDKIYNTDEYIKIYNNTLKNLKEIYR